MSAWGPNDATVSVSKILRVSKYSPPLAERTSVMNVSVQVEGKDRSVNLVKKYFSLSVSV